MSYLYTGPPLTPPTKKPSTLGAMLPNQPIGVFRPKPVRILQLSSSVEKPVQTPVVLPPVPAPVQTAPARTGWTPPTNVDQVQDGMRRRRSSSSQPYQAATQCTIDATGARVCTPSGGGAYPTSSTTGPWNNWQSSAIQSAAAAVPAGQSATCVNVDPTTGVCLDSSILAQQGLTAAAAATTTAPAAFDLSQVPSWAWYVLFAGAVYFLFFRKK